VLLADDGKYHMWASEIDRHCGIHRWVSQSIVVHAVSDGPPKWKFERKETVFGIFSHEPIVARAPTGEYVLFITHYPGDDADTPICNCTDGSSGSGGCSHESGPGKNKKQSSYMTYAKNPYGPWSPLELIIDVHYDTNLAPIIMSDGSAIAWTRGAIWRASHWKDAKSWKKTGGAGWVEGEDPSMWVDKRGHFHIVSHNGKRGKPVTAKDTTGDCGRHLFSETGDAGTWRYAGPKDQFGLCAYPRTDVPFADGSSRNFYRRERPHLVLGPDGFTPVALTTSVIDNPTSTAGGQDQSYTLLQPVLTSPAQPSTLLQV